MVSDGVDLWELSDIVLNAWTRSARTNLLPPVNVAVRRDVSIVADFVRPTVNAMASPLLQRVDFL